jgi:hypothetical protein
MKSRRLAAGLIVAVFPGVLLPVAGPATSAYAATCLDESVGGDVLAPFGCDDTNPPDTVIDGATPAISNGWTKQDSISFLFHGEYDDADTGAIRYECTFTGPSQDVTTDDCASGITYSGLSDSASAYTFTVAAYDSADEAVSPGLLDVGETDTNPGENDTTPATRTFKVDTQAPTGYLLGGPRDTLTPAKPVLWSRTTSYTLAASEEPVSFLCRLNVTAVACGAGTKTLTGLTTGTKTITLHVSDLAGNTDPITRTKAFTVPGNVIGSPAQLAKWRRVTADGGYFSGDYYACTTKGAVLTRPDTTVHELRIRYPKGPGLGTFQVRIGDVILRPISEAATSASVDNVVVLRGPNTTPVTGTLQS